MDYNLEKELNRVVSIAIYNVVSKQLPISIENYMDIKRKYDITSRIYGGVHTADYKDSRWNVKIEHGIVTEISLG